MVLIEKNRFKNNAPSWSIKKQESAGVYSKATLVLFRYNPVTFTRLRLECNECLCLYTLPPACGRSFED